MVVLGLLVVVGWLFFVGSGCRWLHWSVCAVIFGSEMYYLIEVIYYFSVLKVKIHFLSKRCYIGILVYFSFIRVFTAVELNF